MSYEQAVLADGPVYYWKLQDTSGGASPTVGAISGVYDNATLASEPSFVEPGSDTVVFPDQAEFVRDPGVVFSSVNMPTDDFTVEFWTKSFSIDPDTTGDGNDYLGLIDYVNTSIDFSLGYVKYSSSDRRFFIENESGGVEEATTINIIADTWYHIVVTYDSSTNQYNIIVNTEETGAFAALGSPGDNDLVAGGDLSLSRIIQNGPQTDQYPFDDAAFGHLAIYDYILTAGQIADHHQLGESGYFSESAGGDIMTLGADFAEVFSQVWS